MTAPAMWGRYSWRGHEVTVIQQWADPFGRRMIRIASAQPGEDDMAAGMPEADFVAEATAIPGQAHGGPDE